VLNESLYIAAASWFAAQAIKVVSGIIRERKFDMRFFVRPGGMPSSHSSLVTGLAVSIGLLLGFNSVEFAIAAVFAAVVMYDAAGVRLSVSRQSVVLNRILQELRERRPLDIQRDVRELIGHTPFQVFAGAILGTFIAVVWLLVAGDIKFGER